jgi:Flp pilus assembly protein TadB
MAPAAALLGGMIAVGLLVIASAWSPGRASSVTTPIRRWPRPAALAAAAVGAVTALAVTGWAVAGVLGGLAGYRAARWMQHRGPSPRVEQERIEALATWCEQLRDLLAADQGIVGTIAASAKTCPAALRPQVSVLSARLARQQPATAIGQFADEVDDPSGDLVATVLLEATRRSSRTSELLAELAATIRARAAMRLRIEAERAGQRSEARFVVAFSVGVIGGIVVLGRDSRFLDAYDDVTGQLVLAMVAAAFGIGGWWLSRLTRFERPARFLSIAAGPDRPATASPGDR